MRDETSALVTEQDKAEAWEHAVAGGGLTRASAKARALLAPLSPHAFDACDTPRALRASKARADAAAWAALGYAPIPLAGADGKQPAPGVKHKLGAHYPIGVVGSARGIDADHCYSRASGLGLLASGLALVDVDDLHAPESAIVAPHVHTGQWIETGPGRAHVYFRDTLGADAPAITPCARAQGGEAWSIRRLASYLVAPGSWRGAKSGEWWYNPLPTEILCADELPDLPPELAALAVATPKATKGPKAPPAGGEGIEAVAKRLEGAGIAYTLRGAVIDVACPWASGHTTVDAPSCASIGIAPSGGPWYRCQHASCAARRWRDYSAAVGLDTMPTIDIDNGDTLRAAGELLASNGFARRCDGAPILPPSMQALSMQRLHYTLRELAEWTRFDAKRNERVRTQPPQLVTSGLAGGDTGPLPLVIGVSDLPALDSHGIGVDSHGIYRSREWSGINPATEADKALHVDCILDGLCDVAFSDEVSRARALAALLTAACRPSLATSPGFYVCAPVAGSGKSAVAAAIAYVCAGQNTPSTSWGRGDEGDKALLARLREAPRVVFLDNLNGHLQSDAMCSVLTSGEYSGRVLGASTMVTVSTRALVLLTANNATMEPDLLRRVLTITIDPRCERPETRTGPRQGAAWRHILDVADPAAYYRAQRDSVIKSACALLLGAHGPAPVLGSFVAWSDLVGRAVLWATGVDVTPRADESAAAVDGELGVLAEILEHLAKRGPQSAADLAACPALWAGLPRPMREVTSGTVGKWLARYRGRVIGALCLEQQPGGRKGRGWLASQVDPE